MLDESSARSGESAAKRAKQIGLYETDLHVLIVGRVSKRERSSAAPSAETELEAVIRATLRNTARHFVVVQRVAEVVALASVRSALDTAVIEAKLAELVCQHRPQAMISLGQPSRGFGAVPDSYRLSLDVLDLLERQSGVPRVLGYYDAVPHLLLGAQPDRARELADLLRPVLRRSSGPEVLRTLELLPCSLVASVPRARPESMPLHRRFLRRGDPWAGPSA